MQIDFVIHRNLKNWAFPLLKWKKKFASDGISVNVKSRPEFNKKRSADIVIICDKYYRKYYKTNNYFYSKYKTPVLNDIKKLYNAGSRVIFYDLGAAPASKHLWLLDHVDLLLKRQIFKEKNRYKDLHPVTPWVPNNEKLWEGCQSENLNKIQIGWNLGYWDYISQSNFTRWLRFVNTQNPKLCEPTTNRKLITTFRGGTSGSRGAQRKRVIDVLNEINSGLIFTGGIVSKKEYINELKSSRVTISPFGYGEICYRDFEAVLSGTTLIKPDVSHLETFPDFFLPNETYIPCKWDVSDLQKILKRFESNERYGLEVAKNAQSKFMEYYTSYMKFKNHFLNIIEKVKL